MHQMCHFLMIDPTLNDESDTIRANVIRFAYWTCVQFECLCQVTLSLNWICEVVE